MSGSTCGVRRGLLSWQWPPDTLARTERQQQFSSRVEAVLLTLPSGLGAHGHVLGRGRGRSQAFCAVAGRQAVCGRRPINGGQGAGQGQQPSCRVGDKHRLRAGRARLTCICRVRVAAPSSSSRRPKHRRHPFPADCSIVTSSSQIRAPAKTPAAAALLHGTQIPLVCILTVLVSPRPLSSRLCSEGEGGGEGESSKHAPASHVCRMPSAVGHAVLCKPMPTGIALGPALRERAQVRAQAARTLPFGWGAFPGRQLASESRLPLSLSPPTPAKGVFWPIVGRPRLVALARLTCPLFRQPGCWRAWRLAGQRHADTKRVLSRRSYWRASGIIGCVAALAVYQDNGARLGAVGPICTYGRCRRGRGRLALRTINKQISTALQGPASSSQRRAPNHGGWVHRSAGLLSW